MIKAVLQSINGVEIFSIIALFLFMAIFGIILIMVLRLKRDDLRRYSLIPLQDDSPISRENNGRVCYRQQEKD